MSAVAMLGTGAMGSRVAVSLMGAGHDVVVFNRTPERAEPLVAAGARAAATPAEAAAGAEFVISMVRDVEASREVWLAPGTGAAWAMARGEIAIESSTVTPEWAGELARELSGRGVPVLDAPVVGSRPQADAGALIYLVGGDADAVATAGPVLRAAAASVEHVGGVGMGSTMKLVVNAFFAVQVAAIGELLALVRRSRLDEPRAVEILRSLPVTSPAIAAAAAGMASRDFSPMFPIDLVTKDLGYLLELAERLGAESPASAAAADVYRRAGAAGFGADNLTAVARLFDGHAASAPR